jgi:membrane fusion protein, heavy metal efflux system
MSRYVSAGVVLIALIFGGWLYLGGSDVVQGVSQDEHGEREGEHEESGAPHLELSAEKISKAGIRVETAGPVAIREVLPLYGTIAPNGERVGEVAARFSGTVRSVAKRTGDAVTQGEALAVIESNESLQAYTVKSPLTGVVVSRDANPGEQTNDKVLFTVADLSTVWVELSLFPRDAAKVRVGQSARIRSPDGGVTSEGKVIYVAPVGNAANQTRNVRVLLNNADGAWAPGIFVTAEIVLGEEPVETSVKSTAIQTLEGQDVVFVRTSDGFAPRTVQLGKSDNENTQVIDGLKVGEAYATVNSFILKAEIGKGEAEHGH